MNMLKLGMAAALIVAAATGAVAQDAAPVQLETDEARLSYALGSQIGRQLKMVADDIDLEIFVRAIEDVIGDADLALDAGEVQQVMMKFGQDMQARAERERMEEGQKNLAEGPAFLEAKQAEENVQATESGLLYEVIEPGSGESPTVDDVVRVHYTVASIDGEEYDSSIARGEPVEFPVSGGMIEGWTEGLTMMQEGAKWRLYVPSHLAYGAEGRGAIGPNAVLVFTVELLEIIDDFTGMQGMQPHAHPH